MDPGDEQQMIPPREELQYKGPVVVMVGPACTSACEFFSYNMTINDRATVVGQYPSEGAGGSVEQFLMPEDLTVQMTIGRAVDAEGTIHLEGKGVVPDVKVPVTFETLQRQANGEDVVLEAAENALSRPLGAGVEPSGPPRIASTDEAEAALATGASFLEDLAQEQYEGTAFAAPGIVTYTINLPQSTTLIWAYGWCAGDAATVQQNFEKIDLNFVLDGEEVPVDQMGTFETESGGNQCRLIYTALSDWPGGEHHITTTATFTEKINDGTADYEPGDYVLDYTVSVNP
jgi:hypothetical protein